MYEDYYTIKTFIDIINDQAIPPEEFPNLLNLVEQMPEDSEEIANQIPSILEKNFIEFLAKLDNFKIFHFFLYCEKNIFCTVKKIFFSL